MLRVGQDLSISWLDVVCRVRESFSLKVLVLRKERIASSIVVIGICEPEVMFHQVEGLLKMALNRLFVTSHRIS